MVRSFADRTFQPRLQEARGRPAPRRGGEGAPRRGEAPGEAEGCGAEEVADGQEDGRAVGREGHGRRGRRARRRLCWL